MDLQSHLPNQRSTFLEKGTRMEWTTAAGVLSFIRRVRADSGMIVWQTEVLSTFIIRQIPQAICHLQARCLSVVQVPSPADSSKLLPRIEMASLVNKSGHWKIESLIELQNGDVITIVAIPTPLFVYVCVCCAHTLQTECLRSMLSTPAHESSLVSRAACCVRSSHTRLWGFSRLAFDLPSFRRNAPP